LSDLRRKRKLRVQPGPVPLASAQLVFRDDRERRRDPAGSTVVGPDADATVRVFCEGGGAENGRYATPQTALIFPIVSNISYRPALKCVDHFELLRGSSCSPAGLSP
jgi:hypothetical protein